MDKNSAKCPSWRYKKANTNAKTWIYCSMRNTYYENEAALEEECRTCNREIVDNINSENKISLIVRDENE